MSASYTTAVSTGTVIECPGDTTILDFLDGALEEQERATVSRHVDGCPACLALIAALGRTQPGEDPEGLERYELRDEIGIGGMGQVFEAYDAVLGRVVALKCVRSGPDDAFAAQRFEREMALTARLQHPSIIPVYDAGLFPDGGRYFAMRLVEGQPLDKTIEAALDMAARLALVPSLRRACEAVAYAHEQSVLHRDLKPANILIGPFGETVVLDWGLAKDLGEADGDDNRTHQSGQTLLEVRDGMTRPGAVMGTAGYIPPEVSRGEPADTRSDVFSLGKVLETLITGVDLGEANAELLTDFRAIVERATAADPSARYPDAGALLEDLRRFEAGQSVSARDYSIRARIRRFAHRHRGVILLSLGLGSAGVLVGVGASSLAGSESPIPCTGAAEALEGIWDDARAAQVREAFAAVDKPYASEAWARTEQRLDTYTQQWTEIHTQACESTARGEQSSDLLDLRMTCLDRAAMPFRATVDVLADADAEVVADAETLLGGLSPLDRCTDLEALAAEVDPPSDAESEAVQAVLAQLARVDALGRAGRYDDAAVELEAARSAAASLAYRPVHAEVALSSAWLHDERDELDAAVEAFDDAIRIGAQTAQWNLVRTAAVSVMGVVADRQVQPAQALRYRAIAEGLSAGNDRDKANFQGALGSVFLTTGDYAQGERALQTAMALFEKLGDPDDISRARRSLALAFTVQGKFAEAEHLLRLALATRLELLGPEHPRTASLRINLADALSNQGKQAEAEAETRSAIATMAGSLSPTHHEVAEARTILGFALYGQGKHEEAETEFRTVIEIFAASRGTDHPTYALSHYSLGFPLVAQGKFADAQTAFRTAIDGATPSLGPDHPHVNSARTGLAGALSEDGKLAEAEAEFRTAISSSLKSEAADSPSVAVIRGSLAEVLFKREKQVEAEAEFRATLDGLKHGEHPFVPRQQASLAKLLLETQRAGAALPLAEQAWTRHQEDTVAPEERARTAFILARVLSALDQPQQRARARTLALDAQESYGRAGEVHEPTRREVEAWLQDHAAE